MGCAVACELRPTPKQLAGVAVEFFQGQFPGSDKMVVADTVQQALRDRNSSEIAQLYLETSEKVAAVVTESPFSGGVGRMAVAYETA